MNGIFIITTITVALLGVANAHAQTAQTVIPCHLPIAIGRDGKLLEPCEASPMTASARVSLMGNEVVADAGAEPQLHAFTARMHPSRPPESDPCAWSAWPDRVEVRRATEWAIGAKAKWLECRGDLVHQAQAWAAQTGQDPVAWFPLHGYDLPNVVVQHSYKIDVIGGRPDYAQGSEWVPWVMYDSLIERQAYVDPSATDEVWFLAPAVPPKVEVKIRWVRSTQ